MPDFLALLWQFAALEPPLFVFGGVAESALLDGELSRSYGDVDVLIPRTELEWRLSQLDELGFDDFTIYYEPRPGLPLVYGTTRGDLALELSLVDYDPVGNPFFVVRSDDGPVGISAPADLFDWPPTVIDGVSIHTISPLALVQLRAGASATGAFGPERPGKDDVQQARLIAKYFPDAGPRRSDPRSPRSATRSRAFGWASVLKRKRPCSSPPLFA